MLQELIDYIDSGIIPQTIVRSWLKDLGLVHTGEIEELLTSLHEANQIKDDSIQKFLNDALRGGSKTFVVYGFTDITKWNDLSFATTSTKIRNAITTGVLSKYNYEDSEGDEQILISFLKRSITFYKLPRTKYSVDEVEVDEENAGYISVPATKVEKDLYTVIIVDKRKKRVYFGFDSFADLGKELTKRSQEIASQLLMAKLFGPQSVKYVYFNRSFDRIKTENGVKVEKEWSTVRTKDSSGKNANVSYGYNAHLTQGDPTDIDHKIVSQISSETEGGKVSKDLIRVKWSPTASPEIKREISTTIQKSKFIEFNSYASLQEILTILAKI